MCLEGCRADATERIGRAMLAPLEAEKRELEARMGSMKTAIKSLDPKLLSSRLSADQIRDLSRDAHRLLAYKGVRPVPDPCCPRRSSPWPQCRDRFVS